MRTQMIRTFGASLLISGMALSFPTVAAEGLYSADNLLDSDVYDSTGEEVGEVEDILMGNDMSLHSLILETDGALGLGGREVVLERGSFTVRPSETEDEWDDVDYEVHVEATQDEIAQYEEFDEGWWTETRQGAAQAWENTKETAESAWESTKAATSDAWDATTGAAEEAADEVEEETDEM